MSLISEWGSKVLESAQVQLKHATSRAQCMDILVDLQEVARRIEGTAEDICYDRAMELDKEKLL